MRDSDNSVSSYKGTQSHRAILTSCSCDFSLLTRHRSPRLAVGGSKSRIPPNCQYRVRILITGRLNRIRTGRLRGVVSRPMCQPECSIPTSSFSSDGYRAISASVMASNPLKDCRTWGEPDRRGARGRRAGITRTYCCLL